MQLHAAVMKADTVYHGGKIYTITEDFLSLPLWKRRTRLKSLPP